MKTVKKNDYLSKMIGGIIKIIPSVEQRKEYVLSFLPSEDYQRNKNDPT